MKSSFSKSSAHHVETEQRDRDIVEYGIMELNMLDQVGLLDEEYSGHFESQTIDKGAMGAKSPNQKNGKFKPIQYTVQIQSYIFKGK